MTDASLRDEEKIQATVGILTFNSGKVLRRALESVRDFDDILLCDGGSSDDTLEIARAFGARVIPQSADFKNPNGTLKNYGGVRQQLLDAARYDWFLYIDSDESIPETLHEDIRRITSKPYEPGEPLVYRVPIGITLEGRYIQHSTNYPGYQYRFFNKKSGAHFIKEVHERISFDTKKITIGTLSHPWYVYSTRDEWMHYTHETARYRSMEAAKYAQLPWTAFLSTAFIGSMRTALGTFIKAGWIYLRYGANSTLPIRGELGRACAPLLLIAQVVKKKVSRT
jgi:glycosyltransferase involved in cell wall biosynthesis